jgi:UDP-N-acetylmuramoyl-L-alanyl-D-glutamate--2,6-diaminopimelate ligase
MYHFSFSIYHSSVLASLKRLLGHHNPIRLLWHRCKGMAAVVRYGFPARRLTVIGVTGTDGKTTTVGMVAHILHENGIKAGSLSTACFSVDGNVEWNPTQKTSPSPFMVQAFLRRLVTEGCTHAVLEYSSHGMVQSRMIGTWPACAGITNLTPEHLDYHGTMQEYREAKSTLFRMLRGRGAKVLNRDDETFKPFSSIPSSRTIVYAKRDLLEPGDLSLGVTSSQVGPLGTKAVVVCHHSDKKREQATLELSLPGAFNVDNALCAAGCAMGIGVAFADAIKALSSFRGIPGRMERIDAGQPFAVFVDFTVTPASYERTLTTLKSMLEPGKRLLVLTGSCGDRMKEKRPVVGKIVGELADVAVVANEDPYTEDPEKIIDDVLAGMKDAKADTHRIVDRLEAIRFLLKAAEPGDIVILCGKGSDTTMWLKDGQVEWNEREIVRRELRGYAA